jgi:hypothetical protein
LKTDRKNAYVVAFVPIAGGAPTTLASGRIGSLVAVAVDDRNVYWIEGDGTISQGALAAVPKSGGMVSVLASGLSSPSRAAAPPGRLARVSSSATSRSSRCSRRRWGC